MALVEDLLQKNLIFPQMASNRSRKLGLMTNFGNQLPSDLRA
jgi:hypothetical protein